MKFLKTGWQKKPNTYHIIRIMKEMKKEKYKDNKKIKFPERDMNSCN